MCYIKDLLANCKYGDYKPYIGDLIPAYGQDKIRCWSLSALLQVLKQRYYIRLDYDGVSWSITCIEHDTGKKYTSSMFDDPIDACYGMVLRLNKEGE